MSIFNITADPVPSEIMLSFYEHLEGSELELKVNMLFNASCLLAAASNLQSVTFAYNKIQQTLSRRELEEWYGCALTDQFNENMIMKKMEELVLSGQELPL